MNPLLGRYTIIDTLYPKIFDQVRRKYITTTVTLCECKKCGSIVSNTTQHDIYHYNIYHCAT